MSHNVEALLYRDALLEHLPEFSIGYLEPALNGDIEAAHHLSVIDNHLRGLVAVLFYLYDAPVECYREILSSAWTMAHRYVIDAAGNRMRLQAMFRRAQFPLPDSLPDTVRVWRGTSKLTFAEAARGYAWATNRDVACFFAMRFAEANDNPLVIAKDVPRSEILFYSDERSESEAVIFRPGKPFIDGDEEDWEEGYERCCQTVPLGKVAAKSTPTSNDNTVS